MPLDSIDRKRRKKKKNLDINFEVGNNIDFSNYDENVFVSPYSRGSFGASSPGTTRTMKASSDVKLSSTDPRRQVR